MRDKIRRSFDGIVFASDHSTSFSLSFPISCAPQLVFVRWQRLFISCVLSINFCRFRINAYTQSAMWIHVKSIVDFIYFRFYDRAIRSRVHFPSTRYIFRSPSLILWAPHTTLSMRVCIFPFSAATSWSVNYFFCRSSITLIELSYKGLNGFVQRSCCTANLFKWQSFNT